jgi:predicted nucleic acid-binding protein
LESAIELGAAALKVSDRFFLDTNSLVYSLAGNTCAKRTRALELVDQAIFSGNGVISYQVIQEFFNVAFRRFTPKMTFAEAEQYLAVTLGPLPAVHSSQLLYLEALALNRRYSLSCYDSLIVAAANESRCSRLYSEDLPDGQSFGTLKVSNPFAGI